MSDASKPYTALLLSMTVSVAAATSHHLIIMVDGAGCTFGRVHRREVISGFPRMPRQPIFAANARREATMMKNWRTQYLLFLEQSLKPKHDNDDASFLIIVVGCNLCRCICSSEHLQEASVFIGTLHGGTSIRQDVSALVHFSRKRWGRVWL